MRKWHSPIAYSLQCIREKEVKGNAITHRCQPCFHVGCLYVLIMRRTAFICLQWDSLVKSPSCCIPESLFYRKESHFIHLPAALVTATGQQTINLDWFMDRTVACLCSWKQMCDINQKTKGNLRSVFIFSLIEFIESSYLIYVYIIALYAAPATVLNILTLLWS